MNIKPAFAEFATLLRERFAAQIFTTEDSVRYTFYTAAITSVGLKHTDFILEHPHPFFPGAEIDTIIRLKDGQATAVEFKYDRANPGGSNQNRTQRAAATLVDVFRLVKIPSHVATEKYLVYVTDSEMAGYFRNPLNRLHALFDMGDRASVLLCADTFKGFSNTFTSRVAPFLCDCRLGAVLRADFPDGHCMRVFEVLAV